MSALYEDDPTKMTLFTTLKLTQGKNDQSQISMQTDLKIKKANHNAVKLQFEYLRNKLEFYNATVKTNV